MNLDEAHQFLRENHRAVLSTFRADGRPQLSPVAVGVDSEGRAVVSSRETAFKVKNLRRDPRVSFCAVSDSWYGPWLQAEGTASCTVTIASLPDLNDRTGDASHAVAGDAVRAFGPFGDSSIWGDGTRLFLDFSAVLGTVKVAVAQS